MHKKLFIAVLALGLLLMTSAVFAAPIPSEIPVQAWGSGQSKGAPGDRVQLEPDPFVYIQSGSERTVPGSFCDGRWQGPVTYRIPGWMTGFEFYAVYQDPDQGAPYSFGTCGVPSNYTFDVTAINWHVTLRAEGTYPYTASIQPVTFSVDPAFPACETPSPVPAGVNCSGPVYAVTFPTNGLYQLSLPFPTECCETGPYFAGVYLPAPIAAFMQLITDDGTFNGGPVPGQLCRTYNEYGSGWCDLNAPINGGGPVEPDSAGCAWFEVNISLWSEGYTPDDPATHCTPGSCGDEYWFDPGAGADYAFGLPSGSGGGRDRLGVWVDAVGLDTLTEVTFAMNGPAPATPANLTLEIYDGDDGVPAACSGKNPSYPGTLLYSEIVPAASIAWGAYTTVTLATPFVWGTLNGAAAQRIVVALGDDDPVGTTNGLLANNESGACAIDDHFLGRYVGPASWLNIYDVSGIDPEPFIALTICREVLPAIEADCGAGSDDDWPNFAHDNQQTSASSINIGDPNGVKLTWNTGFSANVNFTSPSVYNDIVYQSSDNQLNAISLTTGAVIGIASGIPELPASGNRGNTTVAFVRGVVSGPDRNLVFSTGGDFNAVSAWEFDLETSGPSPVWSRDPNSTDLGGRVRFNASKVVDVGGADVLFVCTEPIAGTGSIWALEAGTGNLYSGWATNPIILGAGAKHGPAVSGGKLYIGTAIGGNNSGGSIYQIDAATGTVDWNYVPGGVGEGWPSGVSVEGDFLYGASRDLTDTGYRYKIDKSGVAPSVVWTAPQGNGLYGTPTIGRGFVYFPLDNPSVGILQVNKDIGNVARNFAGENICGKSVFMVPEIATLSCDAYLFAGDRNGRWWLMNAVTGELEWYRQFDGLPNGTALASASNGDDFAVVSIQAGTPVTGSVSAYKLNTGSRPRLAQCVDDVTIIVPLASGAGQPHNEPGVVMNIGDLPLTFSSYAVSDPAGGASSIGIERRRAMGAFEDAARQFDGYSLIATSASINKRQRLAGLSGDMIDGETTVIEARYAKKLAEANDTWSPRSMAASASAIRTSAVTMNGSGFPYALAAGATGDLDWLFDGTGLGRGTDLNVLELTNDDPDWDFDAVYNGGISVAEVYINYIGGCARAEDTLDFGAGNSEHVFSYGAMGRQARVDAWVFASDPNDPETNLYDSGIMMFGDSTADPNGGAQVRVQIYANSGGDFAHYVPNVAPVSGVCGFDTQTDVLLGAKRTGGCPGVPEDILGEIITHSMSDTDQAAPAGTRLAAIGVDIIQTEVGAYDPLYGDFKLVRWEVVNRDAVAKGPIYIGTWSDWDVTPAYAANIGNYSVAANGYFLYDGGAGGPKNAYGQLDFSARTTYSGVQPINPAKRIVIHDGAQRQAAVWPFQDLELMWSEAVNETPAYGVDVVGPSDKQGFLLNAAMNFGPNASVSRYQAYFGVDATSDNNAIIEADMVALAKRAARWSGFARGDVNDDGVCDLSDVCWLQSGNPIYPAAYSGDVDADGDNDAADISRLLSFVSGNAAAQPEGAWRF